MKKLKFKFYIVDTVNRVLILTEYYINILLKKNFEL